MIRSLTAGAHAKVTDTDTDEGEDKGKGRKVKESQGCSVSEESVFFIVCKPEVDYE